MLVLSFLLLVTAFQFTDGKRLIEQEITLGGDTLEVTLGDEGFVLGNHAIKEADYAIEIEDEVAVGSDIVTTFLDISIGGQPAGRITMELRNDIVPKTVENFKQMCLGYTTNIGKFCRYKGSKLGRIIPNFMAQGGDLKKSTGGHCSIYNEKWNDENFALKHDKRGIVSMFNHGPNTQTSEFFITFGPTPWLDFKYVVFGKIVGVESFRVLDKLEAVGTRTGRSKKEVRITDSGVISS